MVAELLNLEPDRADLVKTPAIGRHFLLFKSIISQKRWNFPRSAYTTEQLARAVPKAILQWAKDQAKKNNRDLNKEDLKLYYREPDGTININGIRAALQRLPQTADIPQSVLEGAKEELERALERAHNQIKKKEGVDMPDINENITALGNAIKSDEAITKARDLLDRIVGAIKKGVISEDSAITLFDTIAKSFISSEFLNAVAKALTSNDVDDGLSAITSAISKTLEGVDKVFKEAEEDAHDDSGHSEEDVVKSDDNETLDNEDGGVESIKKAYENKIAEIEKVAKAAQEEVARLKEDKMRRDWIAKAADNFAHIGKSAEEVAGLFMKLHAANVGQDVIDEVAAILKSADEAVVASGFYDTRGTDADNVGINAFDDVRKQAEAMVKDGKFTTIEKAIAHIIKSNPDILSDLEGD